MAETLTFDISGLEFWRGHPAEIEDRFSEIQDLRLRYYSREFKKAGRSSEEVKHYVGRLTRVKWSDSQTAVGNTARPGQRRYDQQATIATDQHTGKIKYLTHGSRNVSSLAERVMVEKLHVPKPLASPFGVLEREVKRSMNRETVWTSEIISDEPNLAIEALTHAVQLQSYDPDFESALYPWTEEAWLKALLGELGYQRDKKYILPLSGPESFGPDSSGTTQDRYARDPLSDIDTRITQLGGRSAYYQACLSVTV